MADMNTWRIFNSYFSAVVDSRIDMEDLCAENSLNKLDISKQTIAFKAARILEYPGFAEQSSFLEPFLNGKNFTAHVFKQFTDNADEILAKVGKCREDISTFYTDEFRDKEYMFKNEAELAFHEVIPVWCLNNSEQKPIGPRGTSLEGLPLSENIQHITFAEYTMIQSQLAHLMTHLKYHLMLNCPKFDKGDAMSYTTLLPPPFLKFSQRCLHWSHKAAKIVVSILDQVEKDFWEKHKQSCDTPQELMKIYLKFYSVFKLVALDSQSMVIMSLE